MLVLDMTDAGIPQIDFEQRLRFYYGKGQEKYIATGILRFPARFAKRLATRTGFSDFRYMYLLEGGGTYVSPRGDRVRLAPGDLLCRRPNLAHQVLPDANRLWREFYLVLPSPLAAAFDDADLLPGGDRHAICLDDSMKRAMAAVCDAVRRARSLVPLLSELGEFLSFVKRRTAQTHLDSADLERLERAKTWLEQDLDQKLPMTQVAARLGMDYEVFRKRFREATGMAPKEYRLRKKLAVAAALLSERRHSIVAVSEALGYPDLFCFSRQFKAHFLCTPSAYRRVAR
jgi:AraC-like DNA-binding protein